MQLGRSLVGAILGSAIGVGVLVGAYVVLQWDQVWLSIVVAVLGGMGVHIAVATKGNPSYLRGALTCLIAVGAFVGGRVLIADLAQRGLFASSAPIAPVAADNDDAPADEDGAASVAPEPLPEEPVAALTLGVAKPSNPRKDFSTWDYLWLCIAALVAYELGRGSDKPKPTAAPPQS